MKFIISFLFLSHLLISQEQTKKILCNLPIEKNSNSVFTELMDSSRFEKKEVYRWNGYDYFTIPMFYVKLIPPIICPVPDSYTITIEDKKCKNSSNLQTELIIFIHFPAKSGRKKIKKLYEELIRQISSEHKILNSNVQDGLVSNEKKKWKFRDVITEFEILGNNCKVLSVHWIDEGKQAQTININYALD